MKKFYTDFINTSHNKHQPQKSAEQVIIDLHNHTKQSVIVGIAGPSGAGKSNLVKFLRSSLEKSGLCVAEINQDDFFISDLGVKPFSGHHPRARKRTEMKNSIDDQKADVILCYSNAALLFPEVRNKYDLSIAVTTTSHETLLERRIKRARGNEKQKISEHFKNKTYPDIIKFTLPSFKHADLLFITDSSSNKILINQKILRTLRGKRIFTALSIDSEGWNKLWSDKQDRFTTEQTPLCRMLCEKIDLSKKVILEIGMGATPRDAQKFLKRNAQYVGIELSMFAAKSAQHFLRTAGYKISLAKNVADAIRLISNGSHVIMCGDALKICPQILKSTKKINIVYSHSSLHYFPEEILLDLLKIIKQRSDYLVIGLKSINDSTAHKGERSSEFKNARIYENKLHRQIRFFYSVSRFKKIIQRMGGKIMTLENQDEIFDAKKISSDAEANFINAIVQ